MKDDLKILSMVVLLVIATCSLSFADKELEKPVSVIAEVDKDQINIGDRIKLDIIAENTAGMEVMFPETFSKKELGNFSLVGSRPMKQRWGRSDRIGQEYIVSIYTTGTHVIPPVQVQYRQIDAVEWKTTESPQVPIQVNSLLTGDDTDIKDLKALAVFATGAPRILLLFLVILGAGVLVWMLWYKRKKEVGPKADEIKPPHVIAYEELKRLKEMNLPEKGQVKEYYTRLSDIVRHYIENRFSYRAPEMTTEEFMETVKKAPELEKDEKKLLKDFLSSCDMVKFAKYGPTPIEILDSFRLAERLVDQTRIIEEKEAREA
jgi:hypothetical protein